MRLLDFTCPCGLTFEFLIRDSSPVPVCPACGSTDAARTYTASTAHVKDDSIPGGMVIENLDPTPRTFYSKSDYQKELRSRGLTNDRFHTSNPRGPYSTKW